MNEKIAQIEKKMLKDLEEVKDLKSLEKVRIAYLGKKSMLAELMKSIKDLSPEKKREYGPLVNALRASMQDKIAQKNDYFEDNFNALSEWIDVTAPGQRVTRGHLHPLTIVQRDIEKIFTTMGFVIADGPEIETEFFNFDAVNMPDNHPARDMQDTFWIHAEKNVRHVLRTHTSNVQVRYMQEHTPPFRMIVPGRVFRQEATDASHEHTFHQFETLVVGKSISVANFLHIAESFFSQFFHAEIKIRVRPSYFPFVEPGFEFDISCTNCEGSGCSTCQRTGWIEVGGAGMVHQNVFLAAGYEKNKYTGFAWGFGLERLAMMRYKIDDIRHFHGGDIRFATQF